MERQDVSHKLLIFGSDSKNDKIPPFSKRKSEIYLMLVNWTEK